MEEPAQFSSSAATRGVSQTLTFGGPPRGQKTQPFKAAAPRAAHRLPLQPDPLAWSLGPCIQRSVTHNHPCSPNRPGQATLVLVSFPQSPVPPPQYSLEDLSFETCLCKAFLWPNPPVRRGLFLPRGPILPGVDGPRS